jgi:rRNA-processing protein FCF1
MIDEIEELIERKLFRIHNEKIDPLTLVETLHTYLRSLYLKSKNLEAFANNFANRVVSEIKKNLQNQVEFTPINDSDIWHRLGPDIRDKEDENQIPCIERYAREHAMSDVIILTTDHELIKTAQHHNIQAEALKC